jgi:oligopeptide transport system substrate-binding protein
MLPTGCTGNSPAASGSGTLTFPLYQELDTLDPQAQNSMPGANIGILCYEGLTRVVEGKVQPGVAETWEISSDGKTYTFHLRESKWSDGTPVTAQDFEYAVKRLVDPANGFAYSWAAGAIAGAADFNSGKITDPGQIGIKALDEKTLEIKLLYPAKYFLSYLQLSCFMPAPKAMADKQGKKYGSEADTVLYNGPFIVKEWQHEQSITLEKNPGYWDKDKIKLASIKAIRVNEFNTALNMFENGELDLCEVPSNMVEQYKSNPNFKLYMSGADDWIKFNLTLQDKPWLQNVDFRKAINFAIDREEIMNLATMGVYKPATRFVLPIMAGVKGYYCDEYPIDIYPSKADPSKAKEYLDKAMQALKITDPKQISVEFLISEKEENRIFAEAMQDQVTRNLGIDFTIKMLPRKQQLDMDMKGQFDLVYSGWAPDYDDPLTYLEYYESGNPSNSGKYNNPEYDRLVEAGRFETDPAKRCQYYADAEKLLLEDAAIAPLNFRQKPWVCKDTVKNITRYFIGSDLDLTYATVE